MWRRREPHASHSPARAHHANRWRMTETGQTRIQNRFQACAREGRAALVTFVTAGDPDFETGSAILAALPGAGADLIELGVPFTDPMADGIPVQLAGQRALKAGQTLRKTLAMVETFLKAGHDTPIVLMGYYNPIYAFGVEAFLAESRRVGIDGLIVVDLPPEEDEELCLPALQAGVSFIRLATPTTDDKRLPKVLQNTSGFVYYVSMTGVTGGANADYGAVGDAVARIKRHTDLPVAVGFGVKTAEDAATIAKGADGVVVGSALVERVRLSLDSEGKATEKTVSAVTSLVSELAQGIRSVAKAA